MMGECKGSGKGKEGEVREGMEVSGDDRGV